MDATELARCYDAHAAGLVLYAQQWLSRAEAEEIVQEAFLRLAGQGGSPVNVRAWLMLAVRRAALDACRSTRRREKRDRTRLFAGAPLPNADAGLEIAEAEAALKKLPADEREVVVLRIWNGATFEEIAAALEMPLSTVYVRYRSALENLRARLESPCPKK